MEDMHRIAWEKESLKGDASELICLVADCLRIFPSLLNKAITITYKKFQRQKNLQGKLKGQSIYHRIIPNETKTQPLLIGLRKGVILDIHPIHLYFHIML